VEAKMLHVATLILGQRLRGGKEDLLQLPGKVGSG
jgi:hypothetical protein